MALMNKVVFICIWSLILFDCIYKDTDLIHFTADVTFAADVRVPHRMTFDDVSMLCHVITVTTDASWVIFLKNKSSIFAHKKNLKWIGPL